MRRVCRRRFRLRLLAGFVLSATAASAQTSGIRGTILDARGGEPLAEVAVQIGTAPELRTRSDRAGKFSLPGLSAGDYVLSISTVGYHTVKRPFHLEAGDLQAFEIVLSADSLRRTDQVDVTAGPFETTRQDSPSTLTLSGNDVKNLGSVLADDPLRAVQGLPGVTWGPQRNQIRIPYYQRTDLRVNKAWTRDKWKFTLYGELVNLTNRTNYLFDSVNGYNAKTAQTSVSLDTMFPILPSVGILLER